MTHDIDLISMTAADIPQAVDFVGQTMDAHEQQYARKTMAFHFHCKQHNIDDGRDYYLWRPDKSIAALTGLHHYIWGPEENVWLSWFAVDPACRKQGVGRHLLQKTIALAAAKGYRKCFIETYSDDTFAAARHFYTAQGFTLTGQINNYMPNTADMLVFSKSI